jgi:preprotein translocase subunit SecF
MLSGTYSSIFIATPVLAQLKEADPRYRELAVKVNRRLAGSRSQRTGAGAPAEPASAASGAAVSAATVPAGPAPAGADEPADVDDEPAGQDDDGVAFSGASARTADPGAGSASTPRPVTRQQRVTGSAQRRPGAKKKRR